MHWLLKEYKEVRRELAKRKDGYRMPCFSHTWGAGELVCARCGRRRYPNEQEGGE